MSDIEFTVGQKVHIKDEGLQELFEIVSWNDGTQTGTVQDILLNKTYRVSANQLILVEDVEDNFTEQVFDDEDDFENDDIDMESETG